MIKKAVFTLLAAVAFCTGASAQKYKYIDKTVAVVGNEAILISDIESAVKDRSAQGYSSDRNVRCEVLEQILESKLFLMQARIDSLTVDNNMVENGISQQADRMLTYLGGEDKVEEYFGKPLYRLRQEWRKQYEEMSLTQQEQSTIMEKIPDMTPYDVKEYLDTVDKKKAGAEIRQEMEQLNMEKAFLLTENEYEIDYMETRYACPQCKDTGMLESGEKCQCYEKVTRDQINSLLTRAKQ